jgi:23S rRNA (adenine1618-N6)-methyltransferase
MGYSNIIFALLFLVELTTFIADLLAESNNGIIPKGHGIQGLDIGIGANCIYPIIGNAEYGWSFVGTDIDEKLLKIAVQ